MGNVQKQSVREGKGENILVKGVRGGGERELLKATQALGLKTEALVRIMNGICSLKP